MTWLSFHSASDAFLLISVNFMLCVILSMLMFCRIGLGAKLLGFLLGLAFAAFCFQILGGDYEDFIRIARSIV